MSLHLYYSIFFLFNCCGVIINREEQSKDAALVHFAFQFNRPTQQIGQALYVAKYRALFDDLRSKATIDIPDAQLKAQVDAQLAPQQPPAQPDQAAPSSAPAQ